MKLFAVILVAAISISSVLPSSGLPSGDAKIYTCPADYRNEGSKCRHVVDPLHCPAGAGKNKGDRCVIESKYCPLGYKLQDNNQRCVTVQASIGKCTCDNNGILDEGKKFIFNEEKEFCERVIMREPLSPICPPYLTFQEGKCVGLPRAAQTVCSDDTNLPQGCRPIKFEARNEDDCIMKGAVQDPENPAMCTYVPGSTWCPPEFYTFDSTANMCRSDTVQQAQYTCSQSDLINGECVIMERKAASCHCSYLHRRTVERQRKAVLACFAGTMDGESCVITTSVQPIKGCLTGYTMNSTNMCESKTTIAATVKNPVYSDSGAAWSSTSTSTVASNVATVASNVATAASNVATAASNVATAASNVATVASDVADY